MTHKLTLTAGAAVLLCAIQGAAVALTPPSPDNTPVVHLRPQPTQADWIKVCNSTAVDATCYVTRDFVMPDGRPAIAIAVHELRGLTPRYMLRTLLPLGLMMANGTRTAVDDNPPQAGTYATCLPTGCFAETTIFADFIQQLRRGKTITIAVQNQYGNEMAFSVPAEGFAKAYDGPQINPEALARQRDNFRAKLATKHSQQPE